MAYQYFCVLPMIFAQASNLVAMLSTSGDQKKHLCNNIDQLGYDLGDDGMTELMECGDDFPTAFRNAKAFCAGGDVSGDNIKVGYRDHVCETAKALVPLYVPPHVCVR